MNIKLAPKVAKIVKLEVDRSNAGRTYAGWTKTTASEIVNDIVWMALRKGDISKGWK